MNKAFVALGLCLFLAPITFAQDFFDLVKTGTPKQVRAAIAKGAKVDDWDKDGATLLMFAALNNSNPEVITILLKAGGRSMTGTRTIGRP